MTADQPSGGLPPASERLLTVPEVGERLQVCERMVYRHIHSGRLKAARIGRLVRIHPADLDAFLKSS